MTQNKKQAFKYTRYFLLLSLATLGLCTLSISQETSPSPNSNTDIEQPIVNDAGQSTADNDFTDFQRMILASKHRRNPTTTMAVTAENVATYPISQAQIIGNASAIKPVSVKYILDHSVHIPAQSEARAVGVQQGVIILAP